MLAALLRQSSLRSKGAYPDHYEIMELSDRELDFVAGGAALAGGGLVNVALNAENIDVLRNANIDVLNGVTVQDIANNNNVSVGAILQVLGGGAGIFSRQA